MSKNSNNRLAWVVLIVGLLIVLGLGRVAEMVLTELALWVEWFKGLDLFG